MTRKEALDNLYGLAISSSPDLLDFNQVESLLEAIYDDFESMICKNCKHYISCATTENEICDLYSCGHGFEFTPDENFGCNKFERR